MAEGTPADRGSTPWWRPRLAGDLGLWLLGAAIAALAVRTLQQRAPSSLGDLDLSWQLSLGVALQQHLQFGVRYLFTYGPLGFLHVSMLYPSRLLTVVAAAVAVLAQVLYAGTLLVYANRARSRLGAGPLAGAALVTGTAVVALLTAIAANLGTIAELLALLALASCLLRPTARATPLLALLAGLALAFGALFKSDLLAVALAVLVVLFPLSWFSPGRPVRIAGLALAGTAVSYVGIWLACGQQLGSLLPFWRGSWELSTGYSSAMSQASHWQPAAEVAALMIALLVLPLLLRPRWLAPVSAQEAAIVLSVPWMFVSWKDSLVRIQGLYDGRAEAMVGALLGVAWLAFIMAPRLRSRLVLGPLASGAVGAAVLAAILIHTAYRPWTVSLLAPAPPPAAQPASFEIPPAVIASLRGQTVNVLPWDIALAVNHHLRWDPLPEPQTYSAYTAYLDQLDASQLSSRAGAQRLLVSLLDIDGRYLLWDPPAVWDTVLSRYSCQATTGITAVLDRRPARVGRLRQVAAGRAAMGSWLAVPRTSQPYEFLDLNLPSSLLGKVRGFVLRQSAVFATLRLSNGTTVGPFRLIVATAGDGLYVGRYIGSAAQLCSAANGAFSRLPRITAIRLSTFHPDQWAGSFTARFLAAS